MYYYCPDSKSYFDFSDFTHLYIRESESDYDSEYEYVARGWDVMASFGPGCSTGVVASYETELQARTALHLLVMAINDNLHRFSLPTQEEIAKLIDTVKDDNIMSFLEQYLSLTNSHP